MTEPTEVAAARKPIWGVLLATGLGCALLIGLGTWQLQRLQWKEGLIARIEARTKAPPVDLAEAERRWRETGDVEYLRVQARGHYEGRDNFYFAIGDSGPGYHVYTPLRTSAREVVMVNRGFFADTRLPAAGANYARPAGEVDLVGLARSTEIPGWFAGAAPPPGTSGPWLTRDLQGMAGRAEIPNLASPEQVLPFFLDLERAGPEGASDPQGGTTRLDIPNRHLEYALTWYGLAVTLLVMAGLFISSRRRQR